MLTNWLCRIWEIPDRLAQFGQGYDAVVAMSLSPAKDGTVGPTLRSVIKLATEKVPDSAPRLIISNRYMVMGRNLCEEMVAEALRQGVDRNRIITPVNPRDPAIRNTATEAKFSSDIVRMIAPQDRTPRLLVIANHLHMRRVLATFRKNAGGEVELFWMSAHDKSAYTRDVYQERFWHPLFLLMYEVAALTYSKLKGWA